MRFVRCLIYLAVMLLVILALSNLARAEVSVKWTMNLTYKDGSTLPRDCIEGVNLYCGQSKAHMPERFWIPGSADGEFTVPGYDWGYCNVRVVIFERCDKGGLESDPSNIVGKPAPPSGAIFKRGN